MVSIDDVLQSMSLEFFGKSGHKVSPEKHLADGNGLFLDVRSHEEVATISFGLAHHMHVIHIPIDEIPRRVDEIPHDKNIGVFCSAGSRAAMVYLYLRTRGFDNVWILEGGYGPLMDELMPGRLHAHLKARGERK